MSAAPTPRRAPPPRRPNSDGSSFFGSGEFQRILWFAGLLVFMTIFALYMLRRAAPVSEPQVAEVAPAPTPPTPEEIEAQRAQLGTLFEGALLDTDNGDDFAETQGYRKLIHTLLAYSPEAVSERATRVVDYATFVANPDAFRGQFVRARGVMSHMFAEKLRQPVYEVTDVFRGFLAEADGSAGVVFDMLTQPPEFDMRRGAVDVEGVFYRTVRYENQRGEVKEAPYLLVRTMRPVESVPAHHTGFLRDHTATALVLMALAIFCVRLLMYWAQRRKRRSIGTPRAQPPDFRDLFEAKVREERRGSGGQPPSSPPLT